MEKKVRLNVGNKSVGRQKQGRLQPQDSLIGGWFRAALRPTAARSWGGLVVLLVLLGSSRAALAGNTITPSIGANNTSPLPGSMLTLTLGYVNTYTSGTNRTATIVRNGTITGLPTGLTGVTFGGLGAVGATYNTNGSITFNTGANGYDNTLAANDATPDLDFTISFTVPVGMGAFTATSAPTTNTQSTTVNPQSVSVTVAPQLPADVSVTVSAPATAPAGAQATITVTATNTSTANTATDVVVTAQLATGLPAGAVNVSNDGTYDAGTGRVTFPGQALGPNGTFTPTIRLLMPASGTRTVKVSATSAVDANAANNNGTAANANATITVTQVADVAISVSGPTAATPGSAIVYSVLLTNQGPSTATGLTAQLALGGAPTNVTITGGGTLAGSTVSFAVPGGTLAAGSSLIYTVRLTVPATGPVTGTASATSTTANGDPVVANNNGTAPASQVSTAVVASTPSEVCATPGASGSLTYSGTQGINTYYPGLTGTGSQNQAGQKVLVIGSATTSGTAPVSGALAVGDLVLVMQMQGAPLNTANTSSYGDSYAGDPGSGNLGGSTFTAGQYEYGVVAALGTGTVTLTNNLVNTYQNANAMTTSGQRRFQVIRVPQYQDFILTANLTTVPAWNGSTGGVLALDVAGTLNLGTNRVINLVGKGFRGGGGRQLGGAGGLGYANTDYRTPATANVNAAKGEGIAGTPRYLNNGGTTVTDLGTTFGYPDGSNVGGGDNGRGAPGNAGGGGTDTNPGGNDQNTGGGGGSNGGFGGQGGNGWFSNLPYGGFGGAPFLAAAPSRLVLGGGGGAGTTNNGTVADDNTYPGNAGLTNDGFASSGAAGGGMLLARVGAVSGTGTIDVSGADMAFVPENDGSGGGGGGGSVLLLSNNTAANALTGVTVLATGGQGGSNTGGGSAHGPGGGGSGGVVFASSPLNAASSYGAGTNGTTFNGIVYEAGPGTSSPAFVRNSVGFDETPLLQSGANCVADLTTTLSGPTALATGGNAGPYTVTFTNNGPGSGSFATRTVTLPVGASLSTQQLLDIQAQVPGATYTTNTRVISFGAATGIASGATSSFTFSFTAPGTTGTGLALSSAVTAATGTNQGANQAADNASLTLSVSNALTGTIFEDVNYGGGAGRNYATANAGSGLTSGAIRRPGVRVELYNTSTGAFVAAAITDANGQYALPVQASTGYTLRVVNNTVTSARPGATFSGSPSTGYLSTQLAVQTFNGLTDRVGGEYPGRSDADANLTSANLNTLTAGSVAAQSLRTLTSAASGGTTGPDFGFDFDVVTNTNDAGLGSLRQFILNANALGGEAALTQSGSGAAGALAAQRETSIFMIPNGGTTAGNNVPAGLRSYSASTNAGLATQLSGGVALITPATALPAISGPNTFIDGSTQTFNIGNTNNVTLGAAGTVGTAATALGTVNGPEVQLSGTAAVATGLDVAATGTGAGVLGLAIYGFGTNGDNDNSAGIRAATGGLTISRNVLGSPATGFADPGTSARGLGDGIRLTGGTAASSISNNLIGYNGGKGIAIGAGVTTVSVTNNEVRSNAQNGPAWDGIDVQGSAATVTGNLFVNNAGVGIDSYNSSGANTITGNTVSGNGRGTATLAPDETPGIRLFGALNVVSQNVSTGNYGAGVMVVNTSPTTTISQNSIYNNGTVAALNGTAATGQLGIDLTNGSLSAGDAPFLTINDNGDADGGANGLLNFPVITAATVVGSNLVVQGFARPGARIEFFNPGPVADPSGFGEGQTYLGTVTEGAAAGGNLVADTNADAGSYGPGAINGLSQGSDNTNRFTFTIPLTGAFAGYAAGSLLTATATLGGATSEFAGNVAVNTAPVANTLTNTAGIPNTNSPVALAPGLSGTANGSGNSIAAYTIVTLPASGTLTYLNGGTTTTVTAGTTITAAQLASLRYTPASGTTGTVSFTYTVTDANGIVSLSNNNGGTITAGAATYTIPVTAVADVVTTITPSATPVNAGAALSFDVTYTNAGPNTAAGYGQTLTLSSGLGASNVTFASLPTGVTASYNNANGQVTFTGTPPTLTSGANQNLMVNIAVVPAGLSSITAGSTITTSTGQGADTGTNSASVTVPVTPMADVTTTLSGPTQIIPGSTNTYAVNFLNNGPSPAAGVTRTVSIPAGSSNVTATGGTIAGTTAAGFTISYTPSPTTLTSGSPTPYSFSFTAPTATGTTYALTSAVGTSTSQGTDAAPNSATLSLTTAGAGLACNSVFYRVREVSGNSLLERLDRSSAGGTITYAGTTLYSAGVSLNALAFNYADGYLYAFRTNSNVLYRLSSTGAQEVGAIAGIPTTGANAATSDLNGLMYIADNSTTTLYRLNLSTLTLTSNVTLSAAVNFGDMAYNPVDNNIYANRYYATSGANGVARINPTSGAVTVLGTPATSGDDVGSLFFDAAGGLYAATNQGNFVGFNPSTGASALIGAAGSAAQSDGASCVFPTEELDVVLSAGTPVRVSPTAFDVTYTVRVKNTGAVSDANVQVNNFLSDGTNPAGAAFPGASSVTVTTAPAIASGPALALNSGFNGTSSPGLLAGTTALASNATSVITYTVRVTYPSVAAIPTTAQNNSVYASTTGTSPNAGYVLASGLALAPAGVLAGDQSTTGSTLPATPGADTPSPTPVTFANPLVQNITNVTLNNTAPATVLSPNLSATPGLNGTGAAISSFTISALTGSGTLRYNGTPVTGPLPVPVANVGLLTYQPVPGNVSSPSFTFFATDANGGVSNTATYTIPVQSLADVTTTLNGPAQLSTGTAAGLYTVTFANVGLAAAGTVTRTVALPAGATNIVALNGTITGTTIDFGNVTSLAAGASSSFMFSFTAPATAGAVAIVSTTTTTSNEGTNPAPNGSTISATVTAVADVAAAISPIAGTVGASSAGAGFNVSFANNGTLTAAGVTRTVQLPAGLGAVSATNGGSYDNATGLVTYTPSPTNIANGAPLTSVITFAAPASGPVAATASVSTTSFEAGQTANNAQSASLSVTPGFDLLTTIDGPATTVQGNPLTLYVTTANNGPSAALNAQQTVQLIGGLTNVFVSNGGSYNATSGLVTFPALASLPGGQAVANTISFTAPVVGTILAPAATVTPNTTPAGETAPANNVAYLNGAAGSTSITSTAPTTPQANAYATITGAPAMVAAGGILNLTVTVGNAGPAPANSLSARVQLPAGLASAGFTLDGATGTFDGGTNTITFAGGATYSTTGLLTLPTVGTQVAGTAQSYALAFPAPASAGNDGQLLLTAAVSTATSETVLSDNLAATTVRVLPTTDLATTISGPASAGAGQPVSYTATFANNGPGLALGVVRTVQLPAGLPAVTVTDLTTGLPAGTYDSTTGLLTLPAQTSLPAGSSTAYTIGFAAPATNFAPRSAVSATTTDGVTVNNRAATSTTVAAQADVAVALSGPATAVVGNPATYYVTTTNNGPSAATGVATTLQLPANLSGVTVSNSGTYASGIGLVTFAAIGPLASGASVADYVTFTMPSAPGGQLNGVATATATSTDPIAANNTVSTATSVAPVTGTLADVATTVSLPVSTTAGSSTTATATFTNSGPAAALNVAPTLQLPAGLTSVTVSNSGSYNPATGVVTWPLIASQASGNTVTYTVAFAAPASGPVRASSAVSSQTSDGNLSNNSFTTTATVTASYDVTTSLGGPASSLPGVANTYTVTTTNNGPSVAASVTPTVTLPAGVTASNISDGGSQTGATITWPAISNLAAGPASAVAYTFDVTMPASGSLLLNAAVTGTGEPAANTGNNTASTTTVRSNRPPVAANVVNARQSPQGNTATTALPLTSLAATDADGTIASYQLTGSLPPATQGVLYYNNNADGVSGSYLALPIGEPLSSAQAGTLRFDPTDGYAGNVFFTYTAIDNLTAGSNVALYTLAVGQDNASRYTATPSKGGPSAYVTNDVLAFVIDPNGARYNSAGLIFDQTTGALQTGVTNGLASTGTNARLTPVGTALGQTPAPAGNPTNTLPPGTALNPSTGQIYVSTASLLPRVTTATTYTVNITTTDVYGGVTTQPVSFTLGAFPLPVELTVFTAQAVRNVDGLLRWTTASEKNNDHFDVERSLDGRSFEKIGQVQGQGSKASPTDYALTDANAARLGRQLYYRLRQVDADGASSYSPVRTISFTTLAEPSISLWPNPMVSTTNLDLRQLPAGSYEVRVLDATGRVILGTQLAAGQSHPLDIAAVANGTYTVLVRGTEPGNSHVGLTKRLIKN